MSKRGIEEVLTQLSQVIGDSQLPPGKRRKKVSKKKAGTAKTMNSKGSFGRQTAKLLKYSYPVNPFPPVMKTTFTYPISSASLTPGATTGVALFQLNSLFDFDYSNTFGNTQPLYYDQLLSSTGPYYRYRVTGWRVKFTIDNFTQFSTANSVNLDVAVVQGATNTTDIDTWTEIVSFPNVQRRMLQWYGGGSCARCVLEINGKPEEFLTKDVKDDSLTANAASSPSQGIYGGVAIANPNLVGANVSAFICVQAEIDAELYSQDGISS